MKKELLTLAVVGLLWACPFTAKAQNAAFIEAHAKFEGREYNEAIKLYKGLVADGFKTSLLFERLGDSYYYNAKYDEAARWYDKLYASNKDVIGPVVAQRYAQALIASGKIAEGRQIYNHYFKDSRVPIKDLGLTDGITNRYLIDPLPINSGAIDYGNFMGNGTLLFTSARKERKNQGIDHWTGRSYLDLYSTSYDEEQATFSEPKEVKSINSIYHESSAILANDGKTMFFTRTLDRSIDKKQEDLGIYSATLNKNGQWSNIKSLPINGTGFSNAHPRLNAAGDLLYFASNRPGGFGETDIYAVPLTNGKISGKVVNLGPTINTWGRESFPFVDEKGGLYFASDGHLGHGGYDIYYADLLKDDRSLINLGKPINSPNDDYALIFSDVPQMGVFSSNRSGADHMYRFTEIIPMDGLPKMRLIGHINDQESGEPITNARIVAYDKDKNIIAIDTTDFLGTYTMHIGRSALDSIYVEKTGYKAKGRLVSEAMANHHFKLEQLKSRLKLPFDLNKMVFDLNSSYLNKDIKEELAALAQFLEKNQEVVIEVNSHADSRGTNDYNDWLTQRRSARIVSYVESLGIPKVRLTGKAHGEYQLLNTCNEFKDCSEEQHKANRRVEFRFFSKPKNSAKMVLLEFEDE